MEDTIYACDRRFDLQFDWSGASSDASGAIVLATCMSPSQASGMQNKPQETSNIMVRKVASSVRRVMELVNEYPMTMVSERSFATVKHDLAKTNDLCTCSSMHCSWRLR